MGLYARPAMWTVCKLVCGLDELSWPGDARVFTIFCLVQNCCNLFLLSIGVLQIALVAADVFSCVQLFLSFVYAVTKVYMGTGYYPGNYVVSCLHT